MSETKGGRGWCFLALATVPPFGVSSWDRALTGMRQCAWGAVHMQGGLSITLEARLTSVVWVPRHSATSTCTQLQQGHYVEGTSQPYSSPGTIWIKDGEGDRSLRLCL